MVSARLVMAAFAQLRLGMTSHERIVVRRIEEHALRWQRLHLPYLCEEGSRDRIYVLGTHPIPLFPVALRCEFLKAQRWQRGQELISEGDEGQGIRQIGRLKRRKAQKRQHRRRCALTPTEDGNSRDPQEQSVYLAGTFWIRVVDHIRLM